MYCTGKAASTDTYLQKTQNKGVNLRKYIKKITQKFSRLLGGILCSGHELECDTLPSAAQLLQPASHLHTAQCII